MKQERRNHEKTVKKEIILYFAIILQWWSVFWRKWRLAEYSRNEQNLAHESSFSGVEQNHQCYLCIQKSPKANRKKRTTEIETRNETNRMKRNREQKISGRQTKMT